MVCLGFKPGVVGWKAQTNRLSYSGTPFCRFWEFLECKSFICETRLLFNLKDFETIIVIIIKQSWTAVRLLQLDKTWRKFINLGSFPPIFALKISWKTRRLIFGQSHKLSTIVGHGGGQVVSTRSFYSGFPGLSPNKAYSFSVKFVF